jgi:hypothetical protein
VTKNGSAVLLFGCSGLQEARSSEPPRALGKERRRWSSMPRLETPEGVRIDVPFESLSALIAKLPQEKKVRLLKELMAEPAIEDWVLEMNPRIRKEIRAALREEVEDYRTFRRRVMAR